MNTLITPQIETIIAELYVVKIGNKQMTISVFNQMYSELCWDDNYNIVYPVWGKVNRETEWIVFQKGNELRKCLMPGKETIESVDYSFRRYVKDNVNDLMPLIKSAELFKTDLGIELPITAWRYDMNDITKAAYHLYDFINTPRSREYEALSRFLNLTKDIYVSKFVDYRNNVINRHNARNKMIDVLNTSRQIFIAV